MANMSYCRFHNTSIDLQDCYDVLTDKGFANLSNSELLALRNLLEIVEHIYGDFVYDSDFTESLNDEIQNRRKK